TSLAWGLWHQTSTMTSHLDTTDLTRLARVGVLPMSSQEGLRLFDAAVGRSDAQLVPAKLVPAVGPDAGAHLPPIVRTLLVRADAPGDPREERGRVPAVRSLTERLAPLAPAERERLLLDAVRTQTAQILGYATAAAVPARAAFKELGFDSLTSVELRNRLDGVMGRRLPVTLVFDHPTPQAIATHLLEDLFPAAPEPTDTRLDADPGTDGESAGDAELRRILRTIPIDLLHASGIAQLAFDLAGQPDAPSSVDDLESIDDLDTERLILLAFEETD
ncbi:beta-ketoacyl reductase, partial [Frankia sp. Ag45/Mut15]